MTLQTRLNKHRNHQRLSILTAGGRANADGRARGHCVVLRSRRSYADQEIVDTRLCFRLVLPSSVSHRFCASAGRLASFKKLLPDHGDGNYFPLSQEAGCKKRFQLSRMVSAFILI